MTDAPGAGRFFRFQQRERRPRFERGKYIRFHERPVFFDRQFQFERVGRAVALAFHGHADRHGIVFPFDGRRLRDGHGEVELFGLIFDPRHRPFRIAFDAQAFHLQLRQPRPAVAFDDAADAARHKPVARPHKARQSGLHNHWQPHRDFRFGKPEPFLAIGGDGAHGEFRQVVGQIDRHLGHAVHDFDRRIIIRHGFEILAHRDVIEQFRRFPRTIAAGDFLDRHFADDGVAQIADANVGDDRFQERRHRIQRFFFAERKHGAIHEPQRHFAVQRIAVGIIEQDFDRDRRTRQRRRRMLQRDFQLLRFRPDFHPDRAAHRKRPGAILFARRRSARHFRSAGHFVQAAAQ